MENGAEQNMETSETNPIKEDDRKLFIGGLSWDTYESDIKEYFGKYGEVENVNLKKDPYTQKSRGFAFVLFKGSEALDKVLDGSAHAIKGKKIDTKKAKVRSGKIFVGGLSSEMSDDDIKNHFAQHGKITEVEMPFDKTKNQRKGFCFITFEHEDMMKEVLKEPKQTICGKQVDVKKATPRPEGGAGGFGMMGGMRGGPRGGGMRGGMRGRGRGRGGFQGGWDQYGGYGYGGYGDYSGYGGSQVAPPNTTYFDSSAQGYENGYGGYGGGYSDYYGGGGGGGGGYGYGGYGGGYGGGKQQRGRGGQRQQPY